MYYLLK